MLKAIATPREHVSEYAPKIKNIKIDPDKIKDVIGSGGKTINKIIEDTGVKIDIEDDGTVFVYGMDEAMIMKALSIIVGLTEEVEQGAVYMGKVTKIMPAFAIVEVLPNKEGLLHISQVAKERIAKIEDKLSLGQEIMVKVIEVDKEQGRFKLSAKDV